MIKLVLTGVWVCAVTLGSVYFSMSIASAPPESEVVDPRAGEEYVPGELITIPNLSDGAVQGYFLTKLSYSAKSDKIATLPVPLKETATDALYDILVGSQMIDVANTANFDLATFKSKIKDGMNARLHGDVVGEVLVEQLEYLSKADVQKLANSQNQPRQTPVAIIDKNGQKAHDLPPNKTAPAAH